ncbi:MAG: RluA family pseudouridine synthase [Clostridia bacterium]|nr:RluA family pseudouridine synthase [Clostridia bacterium]
MADHDGNHYLEYCITEQDTGREVLSLLRKRLHLSEKKIRSVKMDSHGIYLDDRRVTVREKVQAGQSLCVLLNDTEWREDCLIPFPMELDILYEDNDLLFLNKPADVVCHPSQGHYADSLANGVKAYFAEKQERSSIHLIGRLDKDTTGIVTIAKNSVTAQRLTEARNHHLLQKTYFALVTGCPKPEHGYITIPMSAYLDENSENKMIMHTDTENGKFAGTRYTAMQIFEGFSLCSVTLETGRMHQIRFHMAAIGCPLLGDAIYGTGKTEHLARAALHAGKLDFRHPFTGKWIQLETPLPEDMKKYLNCGRINESQKWFG